MVSLDMQFIIVDNTLKLFGIINLHFEQKMMQKKDLPKDYEQCMIFFAMYDFMSKIQLAWKEKP